MKKLGKFSKNVVLWILTGFFALTFLVYIPHIACFISLALAVVLAPIQKWQDILGRFIKGKFKVIVAIILFILTLIAVPTNETQNSDIPPETTLTVVEETTAATEETTIESATEAPTEAPTEHATEAPTEAPTEHATEAPTEAPAEHATEAPTEAPAEHATEAPTEAPTEPATEAPTEAPTEDNGRDYVLNTNTRKFHYPSCSSAEDIKASNRKEYHGTREELIAKGYSPCGRCHP